MHSIKDRSTFQTCRLKKALSASGLRFARHGASDQQNGTAKHQSIPQIIKAIVDTGAFYDGDWYVDHQLYKEYGQADRSRSRTSFLAEEQQSARDHINHGRQVGPNSMPVDVPGSQRLQRHTGNMIAVPELLESVKQQRSC